MDKIDKMDNLWLLSLFSFCMCLCILILNTKFQWFSDPLKYLYNYVTKDKEVKIQESKNQKFYSEIKNLTSTHKPITSPITSPTIKEAEEVTGLEELRVFQNYTLLKYRKLYELYHKGVYDSFDKDDNIIKGVEPDHQKVIYYLTEILKMPNAESSDLINLAKLYHQGMHKMEPDLPLAYNIYTTLLKQTQGHNTLTITQEQTAEIWANIRDIKKQMALKWLNIEDPDKIKPPAIQTQRHPTAIQQTQAQINDQLQQITPTQYEQAQEQAQERVMNEQVTIPDPTIMRRINAGIKDDPQNVHDTTVLRSMKKSLNKLNVDLREKGIAINNSYTDIMSFLKNKPQNDKTKNAIKALEEIKKNEIVNSSLDIKEIDALNTVYSRINSYSDQDLRNNVKENLYDELSSMVEYDNVVCSTGRITRIIDTLNGYDESVVVKPMYVIREEMLSKGASIRNKLSEEINPEGSEFDKLLKEKIVTELNNDYKDILSSEQINSEINSWIEHI